MAQIIEVPGMGPVEFPDGMSDADIAAAIKNQPAAAKPKAPEGPADNLARMGVSAVRGLFTGGPVGLAAGLAGEGSRQLGQAYDRAAYNVGGNVTDVAARAGLPPNVAAGAGYATNVALQALPTVAGSAFGRTVTQPPMQSAGRSVMQSALKPPLAARESGDAKRAIDTLLERGVNVSAGGAQKLSGEISRLYDEVDSIIKSSKATVDKGWAASEVHKVLTKYRKQVNPNSDVAAILDSFDEFVKRGGTTKLTIQEAQEVKRGTQQILAQKGAYGEVGTAADETQKAMARGLRLGIEDAAPGVIAPNLKQSELMNALDLVNRRVATAGNRDVAGLAFLAQNLPAGMAMQADRSAVVKSLLARGLYSGGGPLGTSVGGYVGGSFGSESGMPPEYPPLGLFRWRVPPQ